MALLLVATGAVACTSKTDSSAEKKPAGVAAASPAATPASPGTGVATIASTAANQAATTFVLYTIRKTAGRGIEVEINTLPPADNAASFDSADARLVLTIVAYKEEIFRDTTDDGLAYSEFSSSETARLYPLWMPTGAGSGELLVAFNNRPSKDLARRFTIRNGHVAKIDTLLTFDGPAKDVDSDGKLEFAGFYDYGEVAGGEQGHELMTYNPTLYYEQRSTGLVLDSALTIRRVIARFGKFYGFNSSEKILVPAGR